ncbi:MAG TPA: HD domain-containing phosphohydrolase [Terriglobia bacterium]|nr:HD domain-containing phosphohydrolase [Terriglobia bacterium]
MPDAFPTLEWSLYDHLLHVLGDALDLRDSETAGHSRRVVRYCLEIATEIGCSGDESTEIIRGALVHDIGKIAIPDAILRKPARLTDEEFDVMKSHTWIGYNMLRGVGPLGRIAGFVLAHHERWDGGGYPLGLKRELIPLGARVFAIADTLDVMTSDRPYRKALPLAAALAEINRETGKQFDPKISEAFLSIPEADVREIILSQKRQTMRIPLDTKVRCITEVEDRVLQAVNIGEGGILLGNALGLEIETELDLEFSLPQAEKLTTARGTVIRKELPSRIAVAFRSVSPDAMETIREYVGRMVKG